jgi:hypothetical protein
VNNPPATGGGGGGEFDTLIAETDTAYTALGGKTSDEAVSKAVRKARTFAKTLHLDQVLNTLSRREGRVRDAFGKSSATYLEFYPRKLEEYRSAREAEITPLLTRYLAAATAHLPDLAPEIQTLLDTWNSVYGEASKQAGVVSGRSGGQDEAMLAMKRQLMRNALSLALHFLGQTEKASVFFNWSFIARSFHLALVSLVPQRVARFLDFSRMATLLSGAAPLASSRSFADPPSAR